MAYTRKSPDELREEGYRPIGVEAATRFRSYGVPLISAGPMHLALHKGMAAHWAPLWACDLINKWPLDSRGDDYDHFTLKQVIRVLVRTGRIDLVDAVIVTARLGGETHVREFLENVTPCG